MAATVQEQKVTGTTIAIFLDYDPQTGKFSRKLKTGPHSYPGEEITHLNDEGYVVVTMMGARLRAHRIAWAWMTGKWPENDIDHINGDRTDNRFSNLRQATRSQNLQNSGLRPTNKTGQTGVHFCHQRKKYVAQIRVNKATFPLGRFQTLEAAIAARKLAEKKFYGEFAGDSSRPCFEKEGKNG